jgi:hypothetical protein
MNEIKDLAVKVFGMTDDEVQSLFDKTDEGEKLKKDAVAILARRDQERLKRIKEEHKAELTEKYDSGYSEAKKKERQKFEDEIRQAFGVESKSFGIDLVKEVVSHNKPSDDVKKHPEYLALERKLTGEYVPKTELEKVINEFDSFKQNVERSQVISRVKNDAKAIFHSLNPILPKDPKKASNQEADFLAKLEGYDFQVQDDGNHLILKEGKRLENENMNPVAFSDLVKDLTLRYFDVAEQQPKGNSGASPDVAAPTRFTNKDEFMRAYQKEADPKKRVAMYEEAEAKGII